MAVPLSEGVGDLILVALGVGAIGDSDDYQFVSRRGRCRDLFFCCYDDSISRRILRSKTYQAG